MNRYIKISRSGLKLFLECPRCFWLDTHHKIKRPPSYPYTLSSAVDYLVKQEFDKYREAGTLPAVLSAHGLEGRLFNGPDFGTWRNNFKGISFTDEALNATLYGAVDDVLELPDKSLAVIDYKSSGSREITIYDDYQKQMDVYSYILSRMGYRPHSSAYFVFYQVDKTGGGFQNVLPFKEQIREVKVDPSWVPDAFERAIALSRQATPPASSPDCNHCNYVESSRKHLPGLTHATEADRDYVIVEEE